MLIDSRCRPRPRRECHESMGRNDNEKEPNESGCEADELARGRDAPRRATECVPAKGFRPAWKVAATRAREQWRLERRTYCGRA